MPISTQDPPPRWTASGPPLSPWHVPRPVSRVHRLYVLENGKNCADAWERQSVALSMTVVAVCSCVGGLGSPPKVSPQPAIDALVPRVSRAASDDVAIAIAGAVVGAASTRSAASPARLLGLKAG